MQRRFVVIEGIDGSGGTTQATRLVGWLQSQGAQVQLTCEPSDGPVGQFIRRALTPSDPAAKLGDGVLPFLFAADRRDHLEREILPALEQGKWVVSDRYYHSSLAYQSAAIGLAAVAALNAGFRAPDLTLFLDLEPEVALKRIQARGGAPERFEALDRLRTVRDAYSAVIVHCKARGENIVRLDAGSSVEELHVRVREAVLALS
jgi:dTMP kinase